MSDTAAVVEDPPVLVIAYDEKVRTLLAQSLTPLGIRTVACESFCAAEQVALAQACRGVLVDLTAMIKAKSEERIVAHTLATFFPVLRVRAMGPVVVPMSMPGDARQEKSVSDFVIKGCSGYLPRRLRRHRRKPICLPVSLEGCRGFTLDLSWGGAFIADMNPERFTADDRLTVTFPDFGCDVPVRVARVQLWGEHRPPGIGVAFASPVPELEAGLRSLLRSEKDNDYDRIIT
ncbi:PilZ domain-containing protein [Geomonas sp. Red32]|uniref:PilZ domain-containing protein n=1 Tax=Geomonas sp. Red32 TaxID=2912856 RepID=UPI00202CEFB4|nr:PilZ domain-containing protein [Geomonas sp. Red32]MCM0082563.1 PilZ domain-containing protein [Geomonas sp. Red32]